MNFDGTEEVGSSVVVMAGVTPSCITVVPLWDKEMPPRVVSSSGSVEPKENGELK